MLSAQGFLDGFLSGTGSVPVVVRPRAENFLNQWESRGHEMFGVGAFWGPCKFTILSACVFHFMGFCGQCRGGRRSVAAAVSAVYRSLI